MAKGEAMDKDLGSDSQEPFPSRSDTAYTSSAPGQEIPSAAVHPIEIQFAADGVRWERPTRRSFWEALPDPERQALAALSIEEFFRPGALLSREGESRIIVIISGWAKIGIRGQTEYAERIIALRGPGDLVGEISALREPGSRVSVVALDEIRALAVPVPHFEHFLRNHPRAAESLMLQNAERSKADRARLALEGSAGAERRLASLIFDLAVRRGGGYEAAFTLPMSQSELASWVDASPDIVARFLRSWRERGIVTTDRRRLRFVDLDGLAAIIGTVPAEESRAKHDVVKAMSLGQRVAEEERADLASYFVETEHWRRVWSGEVDIVFAPKGGGKSAIYSMLVSRKVNLLERGILLAPCENPTGAPAFDQVESDPPTSETEFVSIWKLYFLTLIADALDNHSIQSHSAGRLIEQLREEGLLTGDLAKRKLVRRVMSYVRRYFRPKLGEATVNLDPATLLPTGFSGKIIFDDSPPTSKVSGSLYIDDLYRLADDALGDSGHRLWLVLDRLDIAFAESRMLKENALRALFHTYRDLRSFDRISLKIFLRSDIWRTITAEGFREASHITRELNVKWNSGTLLQLVVQRLLQNRSICDYYGVEKEVVLANVHEQRVLFERVYPRQVDVGSRKPRTLEWCLSRTQDGYGEPTPRELIHLLSAARDHQLRRYEIGEQSPASEAIIDRQALKDALPEVSETRLVRTLYAEYPGLRAKVELLEGQKTHHNDASLAALWNVSELQARQIADRLVEIGFFERRGDRQRPTYWVPYMFRPALKLVQGSVEGISVDL